MSSALDITCVFMDHCHQAATLIRDKRIRTSSLLFMCLEASSGVQNKSFQSLGTQNGRHVKGLLQVLYIYLVNTGNNYFMSNS